jgi:alanine dehydrogenase
MKVGIPREIKNHEYRVAITPAGVHELVRGGHQVLIEAGAGNGSSIPDEDFVTAGAKILPTADDVWGEGDMILKVKEPIAEEYHRMRSGQVLFTYLHLAASKACTDALLSSGITSPTRPSSCPTGRCRCSPPCPRSRAGWRRRSARTTCSATAAGAGS